MAEAEKKTPNSSQSGQTSAPGTSLSPEEASKYVVPKSRNEAPATVDEPEISWTASEFVSHEKSAGWYGGLALAAVLLGGLIYLFTKDVISAGVVLVAALFLGIMASRKPRQLEYGLSAAGLKVGSKYYALEEFRSFAVIQEGAFPSIVFMPLKRFAPLTTIYYSPEDEDKILTILADRLPFEERRIDPVDRLMHRIRF